MSPAEGGTGAVRVAVADLSRAMRNALAGMLMIEPDIEVVAEADDLNGLLKALHVHRPDVLLLDPGLLTPHGLPALATVCGTNSDTAVLICDFVHLAGYEERVRELGAAGLIAKSAPPSAWLAAVRAAGTSG